MPSTGACCLSSQPVTKGHHMARTAQGIRDEHLAAAIRLGQRKVAIVRELAARPGFFARRRLNAEYESADRAQQARIGFLIQAGVTSGQIVAALRKHNALEQ